LNGIGGGARALHHPSESGGAERHSTESQLTPAERSSEFS
jgi:hypothetical protein